MTTARDDIGDGAQHAPRLFAGLAADLEGDPDHRAPLILLHGLTFDRTMWRPALAAADAEYANASCKGFVSRHPQH